MHAPATIAESSEGRVGVGRSSVTGRLLAARPSSTPPCGAVAYTGTDLPGAVRNDRAGLT